MKITKTASLLTLADVFAAQERIAPYVHRTPVLHSRTLDKMAGAQLFFKCEHLQRIGAFKARGAHNAVFSLTDDEAAHGVVTHSSGNHAAALALAARNRGIPAYIVMPSNAPSPKIASVERLGAEITFCPPNLAAREAFARELVRRTRAAFIHPYDDDRVIAGQATAAAELCEQIASLDAVIAPVGGGGLLSGTALYIKEAHPDMQVFGAEPAKADDAYRSFRSGILIEQTHPQTIADGLLTSLSERTFGLICAYVDDIALASEPGTIQAMRLVWEVLKQVIEPSAAVPVAALLHGKLPVAGKRVGVILPGGNVDVERLPWRP